MGSLNELLGAPGARKQVVTDCEKLIEEEVGSKGLLGIPIKAAYAVVKAVKPGFVPEVVDHMLDDFATRLDPLYQQAKSKNEPVSVYLASRPGEVAESLLQITDARAQRANNQGLKTAYEKLRPTAKKHVEAAVPRIGRLIEKFDRAAPAASATPVA
ncbi:MAG TPA: hypothetical protein VGG33_10840 [Polyangia bacterium]